MSFILSCQLCFAECIKHQTISIFTNPHIIFALWFTGVIRTQTFHMITTLATITHQQLKRKQNLQCNMRRTSVEHAHPLPMVSNGLMMSIYSQKVDCVVWLCILAHVSQVNNCIAKMEVGCLKHPGASTIGSQLLDEDAYCA